MPEVVRVTRSNGDPFIDVHANTMDVPGFLATWAGKTDPFIDFLLQGSSTSEEVIAEAIEVLAVTGTNGKTTVSWLVEAILRHAGMV